MTTDDQPARTPPADDRDRRPWLVVDVMNVVGSRPDGWWRDRTGAAARLVARLGTLATVDGERVTAVVDGSPSARLPEGDVGGVAVHHAGRARDAADDLVVALLEEAGTTATVVTADRALAARVRALGATVVGPRSLLARLPEPPGPGTPPAAGRRPDGPDRHERRDR